MILRFGLFILKPYCLILHEESFFFLSYLVFFMHTSSTISSESYYTHSIIKCSRLNLYLFTAIGSNMVFYT